MAKFLIADDHPLFREALQGALANHFSELTLREAEDLDSTLAALNKDDDVDSAYDGLCRDDAPSDDDDDSDDDDACYVVQAKGRC